MTLVSEFAEFTEALRRRREQVARAAPTVRPDRDAAPLLRTTHLLDEALLELSSAEEELRVQNEELFRARLDIEAHEALYREVFDVAPVALLVTTRGAVIQFVSAAACDLLARPKNALVGKPLACFVDVAERPAFRSGLARARASMRAEEFPVRLVATGGAPLECRMRVRAMPPTGSAPASLAWCITEEPGPAPGEW